MKRFLLKLFLFLLPFIPLFGLPAYVLWRSGEMEEIGRIIDLQSRPRPSVLFGLAYSNPVKLYKLETVLERRPRMLALGSSRVMQFRSAFFRDGASFYNAGGGVSEVGHFRRFLERLPRGHEPALILAGLDHYFFNPSWFNDVEGDIGRPEARHTRLSGIYVGAWKKVWGDYFAGKLELDRLRETPAETTLIGAMARMNRSGFRNDGSYYYGSYIKAMLAGDCESQEDCGFRNTLDRIEKGYGRFEYGDRVSDSSLALLEDFLSACASRHIKVIGFLPPYAHQVYAAMLSSGNHGYITELPHRLRPLFARFGFPFFDYSDLSVLGAGDEETKDGFHGSEKAYLRLFLDMAAKDSALAAYADLPRLRSRLALAPNPYEVVSHDF